jgi:hypothetical protein
VDPAQLKKAMLKVAGEEGPQVVVDGDEVRERSASECKADGESYIRTPELQILLAQLPLMSLNGGLSGRQIEVVLKI